MHILQKIMRYNVVSVHKEFRLQLLHKDLYISALTVAVSYSCRRVWSIKTFRIASKYDTGQRGRFVRVLH